MRKIILAVMFTLFFAVIPMISGAEEDLYTAFYQDKDKCELLAKANWEGYRLIGESHWRLVSFGNNTSKFESFYAEKTKELKSVDYVSKNPSLFTDAVIERLIGDGIYIWERAGGTHLKNKNAHIQKSYETCIGYPKISSTKGE